MVDARNGLRTLNKNLLQYFSLTLLDKECSEEEVQPHQRLQTAKPILGGAVVVRLPRPMEGNGVTPIFRSLQN